MKKQTYLLIFFSFSSILWGQGLKLNLSDAVNLALQNNEKIKQYQQKVEQKEFDDLAAYGNFLPSLNFDASYTHLNQDLIMDLSPIRDVIISLQSSNQAELTNLGNIAGGKGPLSQVQKDAVKLQASSYLNSLIPAFEATLKKQDYKTGTFTAIQPLFLGGKLLAAKNASKAERESANQELQKTKNEIVFEVVDRYSKVLLMNELVKTRKDVLDGMLQHKGKAQKLYDEGLIANYHLLRAEVAVSEAERNLSSDQNNFTLALTALKNTLGINETDDFSLADSLTYKSFSDSLNTIRQQAMLNQPILQMIEQKKELAAQNYNVARSSLLPTIAAFGKYEVYPEYLSALEPRWAVGIQLKYNLFNGFKDYLKLQSAKHLESEVEYARADAKKKIDLWVTKSFMEAENNKTRYEKLNATVTLAQESLRQNEKRFETGMGTSLEVIDARLSFEKVQIDRLLSLYQYYNALTDLYLAAGNPIDILKIWSN